MFYHFILFDFLFKCCKSIFNNPINITEFSRYLFWLFHIIFFHSFSSVVFVVVINYPFPFGFVAYLMIAWENKFTFIFFLIC